MKQWRNKKSNDKLKFRQSVFIRLVTPQDFLYKFLSYRVSNHCSTMWSDLWSDGVKQLRCLARDGQCFIFTVHNAEKEVI